MSATGSAAEHVIAFDRGGAVAVATRLPTGLEGAGGWRDTALDLGAAPLVDVLTGRRHPGGTVPVTELLATYPVALLTQEEENR
jgi:(1->4)-alpha-D-glucan 1-alpha-D-glucosylmutase